MGNHSSSPSSRLPPPPRPASIPLLSTTQIWLSMDGKRKNCLELWKSWEPENKAPAGAWRQQHKKQRRQPPHSSSPPLPAASQGQAHQQQKGGQKESNKLKAPNCFRPFVCCALSRGGRQRKCRKYSSNKKNSKITNFWRVKNVFSWWNGLLWFARLYYAMLRNLEEKVWQNSQQFGGWHAWKISFVNKNILFNNLGKK